MLLSLPAASVILNTIVLLPDKEAPSQLIIVLFTLLVISVQVSPLSTEPYRISPVDKLPDNVAPIVCAAVLVIKSVSDDPVSALKFTPDTVNVGASVSMLIVGVVPASPSLLAASVYVPLATVILALPELTPLVGVKMAVRVRPVPLMEPKVPPVTTTSPALPSQAKVLSGSSLNVNVIVAVSPILSVDTSLVMTSMGATVSTSILNWLAAVLSLPAASVKLPAATSIVAVVVLSTSGVNVAV